MTATEARPSLRLGLMSTGPITMGVDVTCVAEVCQVRGISQITTAAPGLLGAIALRGHPVPLFDPLQLAGLNRPPSDPGIAVVATRGDRRIALGFDAIEGLIAIPPSRLEKHGASGASFFAGMFETGGRIVSLVEPRALMSRPDLPMATVAGAGTQGAGSFARAYLTFDAGGTRFGIEAIGVEATVPRQRIEPESLAEGMWLGIVRHHGRRVPVMHLNAVLGLGEVRDLRTAEVVIVRFPGRRLVGFAVDAIRRMRLISPDSARPVPAVLAARTLALEGIVTDALDSDTVLIGLAALTADDTLGGMAALSDEEAPAPRLTAGAAPARASRAERERYLVARAGSPVAIRIRQVARIVMPPPCVTPLARAPAWLRGVFRDNGRTVPLVDLGHRLGHGPTEPTDRVRVLLRGSLEEPTGFVVSGVDHLEWSTWRLHQGTGNDPVDGAITIPQLGQQTVVPVVDLDRIAAALPVHG